MIGNESSMRKLYIAVATEIWLGFILLYSGCMDSLWLLSLLLLTAVFLEWC